MHKWYPTRAQSKKPARHHEDDEREMEDEDEIGQRAMDHDARLPSSVAQRQHIHIFPLGPASDLHLIPPLELRWLSRRSPGGQVARSITMVASRSRVSPCNRAARFVVLPIAVQIIRSTAWMLPTNASPVARA